MTFSITQILIHDACAIEKKTTKKTKDNFFNHEKCEKDEKHENSMMGKDIEDEPPVAPMELLPR